MDLDYLMYFNYDDDADYETSTSFENYTADFENSTELVYEKPANISSTETINFFYKWIVTTMIVPSATCLAIHLYKFFRSPSPQSLANKNLTLYCFFLLVFNVYNVLFAWSIKVKLYSTKICLCAYVLSLTTVFKFIIAVDIFLCFRSVAVYLQGPSGPQNVKFAVYCILGVGIPVLHVYLHFHEEIRQFKILWNYALIRVARLIPILGAFWYIRVASIDKKELWTKFSLHVRLLIMIGGFSALLSFAEIIVAVFVDVRSKNSLSAWLVYMFANKLNDLGALVEGILIGIFFTFKKNTFKPLTS